MSNSFHWIKQVFFNVVAMFFRKVGGNIYIINIISEISGTNS